MIIKITVKDNDFTQQLEQFAKELFKRLWLTKDLEYFNGDRLKWLEAFDAQEEIRKLLNPNITEVLTDEDKTVIKAKVFLEWCDFVDKLQKSDHTKKYLKDNFRCSVSFHFIDRWENGEAVYYFTTNQKFVTQ